ncbi:MAG: sensor histidine kinase, partial [Kiritimatiellae bacterium]|nr:sensor histidine kinase [Kiritimatiellia bacterium]
MREWVNGGGFGIIYCVMTLRLPALLAAVCLAAAANADGPATNRALRTAAELSQALAAGYGVSGNAPFDVVVTVTYPCDKLCRSFTGEDSTGSVVLREISMWTNGVCHLTQPVLRRGDRIHAVGHIVLWAPANISRAEIQSFQTLSFSPLPPIPSVPAEELRDPKWRARPVKLRGVVKDAFRDEIDTNWNYLEMRSGREVLYASFTTDGSDYERLQAIIGAEVEIDGLYMPLDAGNRRMIGWQLHTTGWDSIKVVTPAPEDPFDAPLLDNSAETAVDLANSIGRRRIMGRVIAVWHGDRFLLRTLNGDRIARVDLAMALPPKYGQCVEATGLQETDLYRLNLSRAIWREIPAVAAPEPGAIDVTVRDLTVSASGVRGFQTDYHGKPVRMRGVVRSLPSPTGEGRLGLECDGQIVPVDASACPEAFRGVEIGCTLGVSGTCLMETENWHPNAPFPHVEGFAIITRTPEDIVVLKRPPWWTPGRLAAVIGSLFAVLAAVLAWNRSLRALAEKRGKALANEELGRLASDLKAAERTRPSAELHDSIAQNLSGVSMELDTALNGDKPIPPDAAQHLSRASKTLDSCRVELRNCIWDLRSRALDEPDMDRAIKVALGPTVGKKKLLVRFNVPRSRFSENTARTILNIVRELASNAIRHGRADEIRVAGSLDGDTLRFSVIDDGRGFDPGTRPGVLEGHFGLQGIEERVSFFNGDMKIESQPGKGTKVSIAIEVT